MGSELFWDDFEGGNFDAWTTSGGDWSIQSDGTNVLSQGATANALQIVIADGVCAADQSLEARVKVLSFPGQSTSYVAAIFGRVVSMSTHYMLSIGSDGKLVIRKRVNSTSTSAQKIGSDVDLDLTTGTWYTLRFELVGNTLSGYLDGELQITASDSSIVAGSVGLGTTQATAEFDDVLVEVP
jgi:pectate lyase